LSRFKDGFPLAEWCEQSLGLFQIKRIEVLCEPAVYRSEQITGLLPLALTAPEHRAMLIASRGSQDLAYC
jgi:hypothetical protein